MGVTSGFLWSISHFDKAHSCINGQEDMIFADHFKQSCPLTEFPHRPMQLSYTDIDPFFLQLNEKLLSAYLYW